MKHFNFHVSKKWPENQQSPLKNNKNTRYRLQKKTWFDKLVKPFENQLTFIVANNRDSIPMKSNANFVSKHVACIVNKTGRCIDRPCSCYRNPVCMLPGYGR